MKRLYVEGIPSYHVMEEMHFKYVLYDGEEAAATKEVYHEYRKPALVGLYSIILLMKEFPELKDVEVQVIVNDGALLEQIRGTSTTKNKDILKVAELCRKQLDKFGGKISLISVAGKHEEMVKWESSLKV